jgi:uncharacterized protein
MSDTSAQEPTMEEILASIRRIISEDDQPQAAAASAPTPVAEAPPAAAPLEPAPPAKVSAPAPEEDVLELNEPVDPPRAEPPAAQYRETLGDLDIFGQSEPAAPPPRAAPPAPAFNEEPLVGSYAAEQSASHFGALARTVAMPREGRTLEDVVREMLKPMLRDWLDQNLPAIVEARVRAEVERISRRQDY